MNQQFPLHRIRLRNPKICRKVTKMSNTHSGIHLRKRPLYRRLTTDAFKRPIRGTAPGVHLLLISLQTSRKVKMVAGLVAVFTSDKPLAQAEDDVSHRKAKANVSRRSWEINNTKSGVSPQQLLRSRTPGQSCRCSWATTPLKQFHLHNSVKRTVATFQLDTDRRWTVGFQSATPSRLNIISTKRQK